MSGHFYGFYLFAYSAQHKCVDVLNSAQPPHAAKTG